MLTRTRTLTTEAVVEPQRFCVHCVHFVSDPLGPMYARCLAFPRTDAMDDRVATLYRVSGRLPDDAKFSYCTVARKFDTLCGPRGERYSGTPSAQA